VLASLAPLLDGSRSLEEVCANLLLDGLQAGAILNCLKRLDAQGRLVEAAGSPAAALTPAEIARYRSQMRLLATCRSTTQERDAPGSAWEEAGGPAQAKLKAARVALVGFGVSGSSLARHLALAGVGHLQAARTSGDSSAAELGAWAGTPNGDLRSEAAQLNPGVDYEEIDLEQLLTADAPACDLLICCPDRFDDDLCRRCNSLSLQRSMPILFYRQQLFEAAIGPLVIPRETACYVCYECRRRGVLSKLDLAALEWNAEPARINFALGSEWAAMEVIKHLTGVAEPISRGRLWRLDFLSGLPAIHTVLKLPRCPACGVHKHRPLRRLWEE
jgi:bacteriocin biosynthesis cyclodehydratase domain-containing protein